MSNGFSQQRLRCFDLVLQQAKGDTLGTVLSGTDRGFKAFYAQASWIKALEKEDIAVVDFSKMLNQFFERFNVQKTSTKYYSLQQPKNFFPKKLQNTIKQFKTNLAPSQTVQAPLVLVSKLAEDDTSEFQVFIQKLRADLVEGNYDQICGFGMFQSCCWDLFLERERYSGLVPGASKYFEYLLWDDGGLSEQSAWHEDVKVRNRQAWIGAGWMSASLQAYADAHPNEAYPIPPEFDAWAQQANEALLSSLKALVNFYCGQNKEIISRNRSGNYVRALCEFLPYCRTADGTGSLPSNGLGDPGGPMRWRGLLDDNLSMHKRHLLLDGWITLWRCGDGQWYLQPGSLALLFWAAREAGLPHTESPEAFIDGYEWWKAKNLWFGGHWQPEERP